MAPEPFLTLPLRSCRDLVHVRHRARQIAQLLQFGPHDAICIAAGAFVVAEQAKTVLRRACVCFAIVDFHFRVFAIPLGKSRPIPHALLVFSKPLPRGSQQLAVDDLSWLLEQVQLLAPSTLQDEIAQQNREVLELLTALRGGETTCDPSVNSSAA